MRGIFTRKKILGFLIVALLAVAFILVAWVFVAGPVVVLRVIRFGDTQIDDFKHYPARHLRANPAPFRFTDGDDMERVANSIISNNGRTVALEELLAANDTIAFLVIQDDTIFYERYFQDHTPDALSQSFSVAKSVTSALIGVAIQDGIIRSVDQSVTGYVPELAGAGFDRVTIRDLLTMTSGSSYVENDNPFGIHVILNYTQDLEGRILGFRVEDEPGTVWRYKSGDNALLALILDRALHPRTITEYTQERLWTPLGMEYDGMWSLDREGDGLEKTWCCLAAAARDFAKVGRLYLHQGMWEDQRIFPEDWARASIQPGVPPDAWPTDYAAIGVRNYGYQWWLLSEADNDYLALGKDGQYIYVNPATDVTIVRLGWSSGELLLSEWIALFQELSDTIAKE